MQKGQIFSLDFLISLVAVTAAIGLMIQAIEVNTYYQKEETQHSELRAVAETAAGLIVAGNDTTCVDATGQHLINCVDAGADFSGITNFLSSAGYSYEIDDGPGGSLVLPPPIPYNDEDFYEVKRRVFVNGVGGAPRDLSVKVWKA